MKISSQFWCRVVLVPFFKLLRPSSIEGLFAGDVEGLFVGRLGGGVVAHGDVTGLYSIAWMIVLVLMIIKPG